MSLERFTSVGTARAVDRVAQALATPFAQWGAPLEVFLPKAGTPAVVEHGLGAIPDGYLVLLSVGGQVQASGPETWNESAAWLVADADNVRARVLFVRCREESRNG